jgi:HEAT repeat protein
VDGSAALVLACAIAGGSWLALAAAIPVSRLRARRRRRLVLAARQERVVHDDTLVGAEGPTTRALLERGLRDPERDVRVAAITSLAGLAPSHEWAVDGLIEALANELETPGRVAAELDRLAPRPAHRLVPLLDHPRDVVRFYAVRLLARYPELARRHVPDVTRDPSPNVRAGALETLRDSGSAEALRSALLLLADPQPFVRAHAARTASAIAGRSAAPFVTPLLGDPSWWVREAVRESLARIGPDVATVVTPLLDDEDPAIRAGAALVLQDVGVLDRLAQGEKGTTTRDQVQLERILGEGGPRLRRATSERAERRVALGPRPSPLLETAT